MSDKKSKILFIGGDARQLEMIKSFVDLEFDVSIVGYDNLQTPIGCKTKTDLTDEVLQAADVVIFPVTSVNSEGKVNAIFSSKDIYFTEHHIDKLKSTSTLFAGISSPYLTDICSRKKLKLYELMERDDVAIYNSIPTVEGALVLAINNTDITLHGSNCVVLGLGRVGISMARALAALGAKTSVGVRSERDKARAIEMGLEVFYIKDLASQANKIELLFNTVPALIISEEVLTKLSHDALIIDLASKPGGVDYEFAKKRGIKAILAPGLPGIVAPKSAGKILFNTIKTILENER